MSSFSESRIDPQGRLPWIPGGDELHRVPTGWNGTKRAYPRDSNIHELFSEQAARRPDAVALELGEMRMSYGELDRLSDDLARHLQKLGIKPGDLVGLDLERSFERVVGLLGILKAGAVYWALEENLPDERLHMLLDDARPSLVLAHHDAAAVFGGKARVAVIGDFPAPASDSGGFPPCPSRAESPAYVSYTSGSTGRPKGVVVPHRGVVRLVKGANYVSLTEDETLMHLSPLSFDASTFELWGALLNGGRVVILPQGQHSLSEIGAEIGRHGVTTLWLTAGLFHLMVDERLEDLKPLRQLLAGGDVLCPRRVAKVRRALPDCRLINGYGPTENTTFTCCHTVGDENELAPSVPIGRPISNTRVHILDDEMEPVPVGEPGELYAGGDGLACGYLNRPDLTAERFVPDPFSAETGARLYRTGDRAKWRPDGNIEFLGRLDHQVKIRGFRVELAEIETTLRACPEVREAVVVRRAELPDHRSLIAYVVPEEGTNPSPATVRAWLQGRLPEYMRPADFMILESLPLTSNGKLDRRNLPLPEDKAAEGSAEASQPKDLLEFELIRIWQRLFDRPSIDRGDNFFELGGHSLMAAQLMAEIEKLLDKKLPIAALFQSPTVALLARRLTEDGWVAPRSSLVPLQPLGSKPPLFLIHGWGGDVFGFLELAQCLAPDQPTYGIQAVGLDGSVPRHTDVESMAAHYVREIRSFQPEGPYFLSGYSLGGLIAFEVAQQLERMEQTVSSLVLLDSDPVGMVSWGIPSYVGTRVLYHCNRLWKMPRRERIESCRRSLADLKSRAFSRRSKRTRPTIAPAAESRPPGTPGYEDYYHALTLAYRLKRYRGSAAVFVCDDSVPEGISAWNHLVTGGISRHRVPGTHYQILSPGYVAELAKELRTVLDTARRAAPAETRP